MSQFVGPGGEIGRDSMHEWIVSQVLGGQVLPEVLGARIVGGTQAAEIRIAGYPF